MSEPVLPWGEVVRRGRQGHEGPVGHMDPVDGAEPVGRTEPVGRAEPVSHAEPPLPSRRARRAAVEAAADARAAHQAGLRGAQKPRPRSPATLAIAIAFALPYGWDLVEAIAALAALLDFAAAAGHPLNSYAWLVLGTGLLVPPLAYTTALLVGRGRGPVALAAALGVGLATSAALGLSVEALLRA